MYISKRQFIHPGSEPPHDNMGVWYSPTAYVVKWSVLLAIFVTFFLWITIGYYHARQRLKRGLPPLMYHRWLVPRSKRYPQMQQMQMQMQNNYEYYQPANPALHEGVDPPPAYSKEDMPPTYQPAKARIDSSVRPLSRHVMPPSSSQYRTSPGT